MGKKQERRWTDKRISFWRRTAVVFKTAPFAILVLASGVFALRETLLTPQMIGTLSLASYILAFVGMAISAGFNRSPLFFILLLLVLSQLAFSVPMAGALDSQSYFGVIYYFSSLLLPLNILLFCLLKDRGTFTLQGRRRLGFIFVQLLMVAVVIISQDKEILAYIGQELVSPAFSLDTPIPAKALAVIVAGLLFLFVRQMRRVSPVDNACFHSLLALMLAFHYKVLALPLFYATTAAMLTVAAIKDSYAIAYLDELTGLPSRRSLQEELAKLGPKYTVAMVDIDFFKKINDRYGHDVGDDVLRFIAALLGRDVPCEGKAFRYGGEEFILLFPEKEADEVEPCLEELRQNIARRPFVLRSKGKDGEKQLSVTVSVGFAQRLPRHEKPEEVIKAADVALYRAKESGRNCIAG
ncbi:MAG: GGDEF domain-containing protein [Negativicutes bacterium]|nr:GGDEF domain-containing protein [Negativicutes bacterium]